MGELHRLDELLAQVSEPTAPPDWRNARLGTLNGSVAAHAGGGVLQGSWHRQDSDECLVVVRGEVTVDFDDATVSAGPGACILISARERHRVTVPDGALLVAFESVTARRLPP